MVAATPGIIAVSVAHIYMKIELGGGHRDSIVGECADAEFWCIAHVEMGIVHRNIETCAHAANGNFLCIRALPWLCSHTGKTAVHILTIINKTRRQITSVQSHLNALINQSGEFHLRACRLGPGNIRGDVFWPGRSPVRGRLLYIFKNIVKTGKIQTHFSARKVGLHSYFIGRYFFFIIRSDIAGQCCPGIEAATLVAG